MSITGITTQLVSVTGLLIWSQLNYCARLPCMSPWEWLRATKTSPAPGDPDYPQSDLLMIYNDSNYYHQDAAGDHPGLQRLLVPQVPTQ